MPLLVLSAVVRGAEGEASVGVARADEQVGGAKVDAPVGGARVDAPVGGARVDAPVGGASGALFCGSTTGEEALLRWPLSFFLSFGTRTATTSSPS